MPYRVTRIRPKKLGPPFLRAPENSAVSRRCAGLTKKSLPFPHRMSIGKSSLSPPDTANYCLLADYFYSTAILLTSIYLYSI